MGRIEGTAAAAASITLPELGLTCTVVKWGAVNV